MHSLQSAAHRVRRASIKFASFLVAVGLAAGTGCAGSSSGDSDSPTSPKPTDPKGLYDLRTIDDAALPQEVYHGPWFDAQNQRFYNQMVLSVTSGQINVIANNRWAMTLNITQTLDGQKRTTSFYADGTYELDGSDIILNPETGNLSQIGGTIERGTVSFSMEFNGSNRPKAFAFKR
jgi:hypothetical protein